MGGQTMTLLLRKVNQLFRKRALEIQWTSRISNQKVKNKIQGHSICTIIVSSNIYAMCFHSYSLYTCRSPIVKNLPAVFIFWVRFVIVAPPTAPSQLKSRAQTEVYRFIPNPYIYTHHVMHNIASLQTYSSTNSVIKSSCTVENLSAFYGIVIRSKQSCIA